MSEVEDVVDDVTRQLVLLLAPIGPVVANRLFGTWGLYLEDRVFGLVHDGIAYFRTTDDTVDRYLAAGAGAFHYISEDGSGIPTSYHEVPEFVLRDADLACAWAYAATAGAA